MKSRQLRLIGLAALAVVLVFILYKSSDGFSNVDNYANDILNSKNNAKDDEAINNEISKLSQGKEEYEEEVVEKVDDTGSELDVEFDPVKELIQIRSLAPMVIFSKTFCPYSKRLKKLLTDNYEITPQFFVVELDKHKHGNALQEHLQQISGRGTVPNVLIGTSNDSKGGCDEFLNLHESGKLAALLNEWGNKKLSVKKLETPSNM